METQIEYRVQMLDQENNILNEEWFSSYPDAFEYVCRPAPQHVEKITIARCTKTFERIKIITKEYK